MTGAAFGQIARRFGGPIIVALAGIVMLAWSWGTWPDPVIDFGREIYVPWRLSEGQVLYRDIASYFNGPLSPYAHALVFKVFGPSLLALVIFNLIVIAILVTLLYRLTRAAAGELAAVACGITFFVLFAFAQLVGAGNYNYVTPYSYELTHGIALTAGAIVCLDRWHRTRGRAALVATAALLGLVFLTKAEVFVGAAAAVGAGFIASVRLRNESRRQVLRDSLTLVCGALAPVAITLLLLLVAGLSPTQALRGIAGAWRWIGDRRLLDLPYFRELAGTLDVGQSLRTIATWTGAYGLVFGAPALLGLFLRRAPGWMRGVIAGAVFVVWSALGIWNWQQIDWNNFIRPIPVLLAVAGVVFAIQPARRRDLKHDRVLSLALIVWGLAMLAKMPLNAHIYHYGFALAMPAALAGIALIVGWLPARIDRAGGSGAILRAAALAGLVVAIYAHAHAFDRFWSIKTFTVGSGADAFRADARALAVNAAIAELAQRDPAGRATLAVVPEGLLVNYLARRVNPTGQLNFTPPAIIMYGQDEMLRAFGAHAPDYILLTDVNTQDYGAAAFGVDYAQELGAWMKQNYSLARSITTRAAGAGPSRFQLLERRSTK
jgi:hypothetical protein